MAKWPKWPKYGKTLCKKMSVQMEIRRKGGGGGGEGLKTHSKWNVLQ